MPDPYDRHARPGKWWGYYGGQPARTQTRARAAKEPDGKRPPGKKDPDLCKGQHWKSTHTPEIGLGKTRYKTVCGWRVDYKDETYWFCLHVLTCSGCGKDFGGVFMKQCPLYHDVTPAEQAWIGKEIEERKERRARWKIHHRPVITGPQGYRKKR
jgi:hypothetical protein